MVAQYIMDAFAVVFTPFGFISLFLAVLLGLIFGMLPGLTATMAVALLTGLTYSFGAPSSCTMAASRRSSPGPSASSSSCSSWR